MFSEKLGPYGSNPFTILVVDLMHEFELGVWKALFAHLLQILNTENLMLVHTLDQQYTTTEILSFKSHAHVVQSFHQVPTFGRDTIQQFANNISELKKLAAHNFEDILQVSYILQYSFDVFQFIASTDCDCGC